MKAPKKCPVTGQEMRFLFNHRVLGKYDVAYFYCDASGIIQTEEPYWLEDAYKTVISELDTWIAQRNYSNAKRLESLLSLLFSGDQVFVDVACGYGILTRLMRDIGFNFFGVDKFCARIFSKPFEPPPNTKAAAVCAFEVLEHLPDPVQFLSEQLSTFQTDTVIASTALFRNKIPDFDWPYYSFESGQHITLYQPRSLRLIAESLNCRFFPLPGDIHLITRRNIPLWKLFLIRTRYVRKAHNLITRFVRRKRSFTLSDYEMLRQRILESANHPPTSPISQS
jgi:SAM-dependent methyltransferase